MSFRILIELDEATPFAAAMQRGLADRTGVNRAVAASALPVYQRNFLTMAGSNHNPFGVRSSFWNRMLSGTTAEADDEAATIRMPREVALRFFGGTVVPKVASLLAIPARAEAYNKSPRDFSDLRLIMFTKPGGGLTFALAQADQQAINYRTTRAPGAKRAKGEIKVTRGPVKGGLIFYWLVPQATIQGNSAVLPPVEEVFKAIDAGVTDYLANFKNRRRG